jgi:small ligand-binding sensory domain FIST
MLWASAGSDAASIEEAVERIADSIRPAMQGEPIDLLVAFVSRHFADRYGEVPGLLAEALPNRLLAGCSAGGVIGGGREIERRPGVSLTAARLPEVEVRAVRLDGSDLPDLDDPPGTWSDLLETPRDPVPHFIVIADPFTFPTAVLLSGLDYAYPKSVKIGGLASGAAGPGGNALFSGDQLVRGGALVVSLSGAIGVEAVVAQGCRPIGRPMRITQCRGHLLFALDGKSPLETARETVSSLPETERELAARALFLGVSMNELVEHPGPGDFLIRNLVGMDPETGALAIGENLRVGQTVQFHVRDSRSSAEDLDLALASFREKGQGADARGALLFSCLGRGIHLYGRADHDTDAFRRVLGDTPLGGFFCNGEIGPVGGVSYLHGFTSSFGIFSPARR